MASHGDPPASESLSRSAMTVLSLTQAQSPAAAALGRSG